MRPYALTGHRHEAEVRQVLEDCGEFDVRMAITSVEMVRGAAVAVHVTLPTGLEEKDLWKTLPEKKFRDAADYKGGEKLKAFLERNQSS